MRLLFSAILLAALTHSVSATDSTGESLAAIRLGADTKLSVLADPAVQLRYFAPGIALVNATDRAYSYLQNSGIEPFLTDTAHAGERYFLSDHRHGVESSHATNVYEDPAGWRLLRIPLDRFGDAWEQSLFLWPLPERYDPSRLIAGIAAKPLQAPDSGIVAELIGQVDEQQLRAHVENLSLIDPQLGSTAGNLRTRFSFREETFESTQYIRDQLGTEPWAAKLGQSGAALVAAAHAHRGAPWK